MAKRGTHSTLYPTAPASARQAALHRHVRALHLADEASYRRWCSEQGFPPLIGRLWWLRRQQLRRAERLATDQAAAAARDAHIRRLGLAGTEEYAAWCERHGFSQALHKSAERCAHEVAVRQADISAAALAEARSLRRSAEEMVRAVFERRLDASTLRTALEVKIGQLSAALRSRPRARKALLRLLLCAARHDRMLCVEAAISALGLRAGNSYPDALLRLAERQDDWLRAPEDWKPDSRSARRQFGSLARFLLARYEVPAFLDAAWFEGDGQDASHHRDWFVHIARGQNIRTADLPVALTKLAAHHFLRAPRDTTIVGALRWAQALGIGGSERLARNLGGTRLAEILPDEPFWETAIRFLARNPQLDAAQVAGIVEYLYHRRVAPQMVLRADGRVDALAPPEPEFSMKGRTASALLRRVEAWRRQQALEAREPDRDWLACGIQGMRLLEPAATPRMARCWTVVELLSARALQTEGRNMHNCVATYVEACARGSSAIWSVRVAGEGARPRSVMTLEVALADRRIVQARGRCNALPGDEQAHPRLRSAVEIVRQWAKQQGLEIAKSAW